MNRPVWKRGYLSYYYYPSTGEDIVVGTYLPSTIQHYLNEYRNLLVAEVQMYLHSFLLTFSGYYFLICSFPAHQGIPTIISAPIQSISGASPALVVNLMGPSNIAPCEAFHTNTNGDVDAAFLRTVECRTVPVLSDESSISNSSLSISTTRLLGRLHVYLVLDH